MNSIFGRKNKTEENDEYSGDRRRSLSTESDSLVIDDNQHSHIQDLTQRKGSITQILLGPKSGLFGTHVPETHQTKKVTLDDFMNHYKRYQINGDGFEKTDYVKDKVPHIGGDMMHDMWHGKEG